MEYLSTQETAAKWGVSVRQVQRLLHENRIESARKYGVSWMIPADAAKPDDPRGGSKSPCDERDAPRERKSPSRAEPLRLECSFFPMLYIRGGRLDEAYKRCKSDEERQLFDLQLAYFRGEARAAYHAAAALWKKTKHPQIKLGCGVFRALAAMYAGDLAAWRSAYADVCAVRVAEDMKIE